MRLFEIDRELERFEGRLADVDGELDEEMEGEWQHLIENREDKWRSYIAVILQLQAEETGYAVEAERLRKAARTRANSVVWLKQQLLWSLEQAGIKEAKTDIGKVKIMKASQRPVVLKVEVKDLPEEYKRIPPVEARLSEIAQGLKEGNIEAEGVAEFSEAKHYVRIF